MFKKGFTLIELLVVIAVIAVLATAVLSSINPIEQINKAKDTGSKSDAAEFLSGAERYFTTFQCYPWDVDAQGVCPAQKPITGRTAGPVGTAPYLASLTELANKNELKSQFVTRIQTQTTAGKNVLIVSEEANSSLVHVCFQPSSKTFAAQGKFANDGITVCSGANCFICVP